MILRTKLHVPGATVDYVDRPALMARIDSGLAGKLTLVVAPPGYGKTTLVARWLQNRQTAAAPNDARIRAAWYSIDETDNDLYPFAAYLRAAFTDAYPDRFQEWTHPEQRANRPTPEELAGEIILPLLNIPDKLVIVLDDYHTINDPQIHRLVGYMLRYLPDTLHVVITTRHDLPVLLTVNQLRVRQELLELRAGDLALSLDEAAALLASTVRSPLTDDQLRALWERTEGWAAGLRLASISLSRADDPANFFNRFSRHTDRNISGYLLDEVIGRQSPMVVCFLLATAILSRFNKPLATVLLGLEPQAGSALFETVLELNLFTIQLDNAGVWYRYHTQFQMLLAERLPTMISPENINTLHRQAAVWLVEHDDITEALRHYVAADEAETAAVLIEANMPALLNDLNEPTLKRWLDQMPEALVDQRPGLLLGRAWINLANFNLIEIRALLARVDHLLETSPPAGQDDEILRLQQRALQILFWTADDMNPQTLAQVESLLGRVPPGHDWLRVLLLRGLAQQKNAIGQFAEARALFQAEIAGNLPGRSSKVLAQLHMGLTNLDSLISNVDTLQRSANRFLVAVQHNNSGVRLFATYFVASAMLEKNQIAEAIPLLEGNLTEYSSAPSAQILFMTYQALLPHYARSGRLLEAKSGMSILSQVMQRPHDSNSEAEYRATLAWYEFLAGNRAAAADWVETVDDQPTIKLSAFRGHILATLLIGLGGEARLERAIRVSDHLLTQYKRFNGPRGMMQSLVLLAQANWLLDQRKAALQAIARAVDIGYPLGFRLSFIVDKEVMGPILLALSRRELYQLPASQLLHELTNLGDMPPVPKQSAPTDTSLFEPLTYREIEVLTLLVENLSYRNIGQKLFISPNTVRNHAANVYRKLNVVNRWEAAAQARLLGILREK